MAENVRHIRDVVIPNQSTRILDILLLPGENGIVNSTTCLSEMCNEEIEIGEIDILQEQDEDVQNNNSVGFVTKLQLMSSVPITMRKYLLYQQLRAG